MNFGVGGYSSQSELQLFIETIRIKDYGVKEAIFYDGVNEVYRYIEKLQDSPSNKEYSVLGYPFMDAVNTANLNFSNTKKGIFIYKSSLIYLFNKYLLLTGKTNNINYLPLDEGQLKAEAKNIIDIYEKNITDINAIAHKHGIKTKFFWQPSIFTVSEETLPNEYRKFILQNPVASKLFIYSSEEISRRKNLRNVVNLSNALDRINIAGGFYDPVHLTGFLNKYIAGSICENY